MTEPAIPRARVSELELSPYPILADVRPRTTVDIEHIIVRIAIENGNQLIAPVLIRQSQSERIDRRSRLGGMLNFYERAPA